ncbi:hypothetical protein B0H10DRAFT_2061505 [Mycena sp. CBHHK59/15]|nr:hypothetical protein B0H10DRAFT_2061505 [Mycena sp. CBHHK59/15]
MPQVSHSSPFQTSTEVVAVPCAPFRSLTLPLRAPFMRLPPPPSVLEPAHVIYCLRPLCALHTIRPSAIPGAQLSLRPASVCFPMSVRPYVSLSRAPGIHPPFFPLAYTHRPAPPLPYTLSYTSYHPAPILAAMSRNQHVINYLQ